MTRPRNVAVLVFDDVEVLDFAGPYEVFNVASDNSTPPAFYVYSVGITGGTVTARGRLDLAPRYSIADCPAPDVLIVPGGYGTRPLLKHKALLSWLAEQASRVEVLLSVCTGALLLARAGLLVERAATTHHTALDRLAELSPTTRIQAGARFVQSSERIWTATGVSAGIDLALHIVERLEGEPLRLAVEEEMEYGSSRHR